jgi:hypothetical protein
MSGARTHTTLRVDHAVPGNGAGWRERVKGVSDETGLARQPRQQRYLSIGGHASAGDAAHHCQNALVRVAPARRRHERLRGGPERSGAQLGGSLAGKLSFEDSSTRSTLRGAACCSWTSSSSFRDGGGFLGDFGICFLLTPANQRARTADR